MKNTILLILLAIMASCGTVSQQSLSPSVYYKNDLIFTYETGGVKEEKIKNFFKRFQKGKYRTTQLKRETVEIHGVGVLPYLDQYKLRVGVDDANFFAVTTCHEENTTGNPDSGLRIKDEEVKFTYEPTIERGKACPLFLASYSKKQKYSAGIVLFEDPRYQLPSVLNCNGYEEQYEGVSICESRQGLIQKISFSEPVKLLKPVNGPADRKEACPAIGKDGDIQIEFILPNRECFYGFIGMNSKKIHQLFTIGYEEIIVKE